jgi:catechol 2,3-dioxygenase-like lactoylglutathione lyase family enzyme
MSRERKLGRRRIGPRHLCCYSLTVFTRRWNEVRNFYVGLLGSEVTSERENRYLDLSVGGLPISFRVWETDDGRFESYFHLYLALAKREPILERLRDAGIIVREEGPYMHFLDPEGRVINLTEDVAVLR